MTSCSPIARDTRCNGLQDVRDEAARVLLKIALDNFASDDVARKLTIVARDERRAIAAEMSLTFRTE